MARVSVVIPCYNSVRTIERAVRSVTNQSLAPHEVLVVDDASSDGSVEVIARLQEEFPTLRLVRHLSNQGPARTRNDGLDLATGDLVAFLDADDEWVSSKLEIQAGWMAATPDCVLSGHQIGSTPIAPASFSAEKDTETVGQRRILRGNPFATSSVMIRSDADLRFDPSQRFSEEFAVWLRVICVDGARAVVIGLPLAIRHRSRGSLSSRLFQMERAELHNFGTTRRAGGITTVQWAFASAFSLAKFTRRLAVRALE